ncbi:Hypothetical predicted protein [Octopus vulgaris]|uniref:Reelin domain-containing protein n=1 Tax=Octopus vulgaris TaxID=6645 RepID=A0AA36BXF0_OCTVU|nr:Hypothetical predicted protein [Octopus vulgaris]
MPHHGTGGPQQSTSPYRIVAEATYTPQGAFLRGVITGSEAFKGFILQARNVATGATAGQFVWFNEESARTLDCVHPNDTLTHRNINEKQKIPFIWTSDQNKPEVKKIQFQATVVKSYEQFWTNIHSNIINLKEEKSPDSSLIPAKGTDTSTDGTPHGSNHDQGQQKKKPASKFVGEKTHLHPTSVTETEHRTGDGVGDNQPPSSSVTQPPFQQPPSDLRPHQKPQWEQRQWPQNFPPVSHLPQQHPSHHHQQQQQQQQQQPNMWFEPRWPVRPNRGFPSSAFPQNPRLNGQMPGNSQTSDLDGVISFPSPLINRCHKNTNVHSNQLQTNNDMHYNRIRDFSIISLVSSYSQELRRKRNINQAYK